MAVYVVTSQVDYDPLHVEGVWETMEGAESWVKCMYESWEKVGDYRIDYYIKEYTLK
jgi:hypothetical protein